MKFSECLRQCGIVNRIKNGTATDADKAVDLEPGLQRAWDDACSEIPGNQRGAFGKRATFVFNELK